MKNFGEILLILVTSLALLNALSTTRSLATSDTSGNDDLVNPTFVNDTSAVCLAGNPAAYYYSKGFGEGISNWMVYLRGGGWCMNVSDCDVYIGRKGVGANATATTFVNLLSRNKEKNPDFYNWNRIDVRYCDASSFTGDSEMMIGNGTKLYFRGARIFSAIMKELLNNGMGNAENGSKNALPTSCTSRLSPEMCFFPENLQADIQTPIFFLMSGFDRIQIQYTMMSEEFDTCALGRNCTSNQIKIMQELRCELLSVLPKQCHNSKKGILITSPYGHTQVLGPSWYFSAAGTGETIEKFFAEWYFDNKGDVKVIDENPCPYYNCLSN
ncbi:pectin acetylesterase 8-like [Ipomoea triloba]|uniref:pectin acetylesterase 8-like n=1 Tax=Ipomoea triloba TaxID=35885 RepID=UPI00125DB632|nr:pectin acetylesterase 8-like [Ipomoea triloba]